VTDHAEPCPCCHVQGCHCVIVDELDAGPPDTGPVWVAVWWCDTHGTHGEREED